MGKDFSWPGGPSRESRCLTTGPVAQHDSYASLGLLGSLYKILQTRPKALLVGGGRDGRSPLKHSEGHSASGSYQGWLC